MNGSQYPLPINRTTINQLYNMNLSEDEIEIYLSQVRDSRFPIRTSEDVVLNSVGSDLCEKFFRGYTLKQWGMDLSELSAGVAARIPTRTNDDDRYFNDTMQFMPANGYIEMFDRMLTHENITIKTSTSLEEVNKDVQWGHVIYTGPIDAFFNHKFGKLPYRSLSFDHQHLSSVSQLQNVGTVNYPNDHEFTCITEFKHLTGQECEGTSIVREYPKSEGDPYYPIPRPDNEELFKRYRELADDTATVTFVGRLAEYQYYNMDQVVAAALVTVEKLLD